jgi:NAD(P)-dependent dehydrogenase (short-subunit alcohol dehydrogenase family)
MLAVSVLRDGLLRGRAIALAGAGEAPLRQALERLGARVERVPSDGDVGEDEERVGDWARAVAPLHAVVYDAWPVFGSGGDEALAASLECGWVAVREVANGALIPGDGPGKVLLLGPPAGSGPRAEAARAGLENLARTLSVEWARYGVTTAMIAPGPTTTGEELAELVCFLVSTAGEYFSGCRLELSAAAP